MRSLVHSYLDDPPPTTLHHGYERLAIESALRDARLQQRGRLRAAVVRFLRGSRADGAAPVRVVTEARHADGQHQCA